MRKHIWIIMLVICAAAALGDNCIIKGWVFYYNGSAVPSGTDVNITNTGTGETRVEQTGSGDSNFYFRAFTCTQGSDVFDVFSSLSVWNGTNSGLATELNLFLNITYGNVPPRWNASLPDLTLDEDNATGIDNATYLPAYAFDFDKSPLSFSIQSQSNSGLINASVDSDYLDIGVPAADQNGVSNVCVVSNDGTDNSGQDCFTITVNAIPDNPDFTAADDNVSGYVKGGSGITITTTSSDVDAEQVTLYVCSNNNVGAGGCGGVQRCTATSASNPGCTFTAESDVGEHSWWAFVFDSSGLSAVNNFTANYSTDNSLPTVGSVSVENGAVYHSSDTTLDFNWSGFSDTGSGIKYYYYSFIDQSGTQIANRVDSTSSSANLTGAQEGANTVYVWAEDQVGNIGSAASDQIIVDTEAPVLYDNTQTPSDLRSNFTGAVIVTVRINDTSGINTPQIQYRFNGGWYAWTDMTNTAGNNWQYSIAEPVNTWQFYEGDDLIYNISVTDLPGQETWEIHTDSINRFNAIPVFNTINNQIFTEGVNSSISLSATDADGDSLTFTSTENFTIVSTGTTTATAYWIPGNDDVGTLQVTFNVTDGIESDSETITIQVEDQNSRPVLDPVGDIYVYEHIPFIKYLTGYDPDNRNSFILDNDILIFDKTPNLNWFRMNTYFNVSNQSYYGLINFTAYTGHRGAHNFTIYLTDGDLRDEENITLTVGYCGDLDSGDEPLCDSDYEDCSICPQDCGSCTEGNDKFMAIIIDPRNCLDRNFSIWTYELWNRATCPTEGKIIEGMEVCQNLSSTKVEVFSLKLRKWEKIEEYITDDNGEITYVPTTTGELKLVATHRGYPIAYEYLEIWPCIEDEVVPEKTKINKTEIPPNIEKPNPTPPAETEPIPVTKETGLLATILWFTIPAIVIVLASVGGFYYYDKNKDRVAWILKSRIWSIQVYKLLRKRINTQIQKLKTYLGYDK